MSTNLEAVYENGVFRPLQPVQLPEHQRVMVTIASEADAPEGGDQIDFVLPTQRWEQFCAALDAPPTNVPALRQLLTRTHLPNEQGSSSH
jgi:predicted DNA-binding antitoxin AbrB/MazE fold protein